MLTLLPLVKDIWVSAPSGMLGCCDFWTALSLVTFLGIYIPPLLYINSCFHLFYIPWIWLHKYLLCVAWTIELTFSSYIPFELYTFYLASTFNFSCLLLFTSTPINPCKLTFALHDTLYMIHFCTLMNSS